MSDLRKFFSSSSSDDKRPTKRKKLDEDTQLETALELSERQSRLDSMNEEEQLQEAIRRSKESESVDSNRASSSSSKLTATAPLAPLFSGKTSSDFSTTFEAKYLNNKPPRVINKLQGSLDLLYFPGWIGKEGARKLLHWMLEELNWHRVKYIRPGTNIEITTPRYTTTFGRDDTKAPDSSYRIQPKKIPTLLLSLKEQVEVATNQTYNCLIINYYADGKDSISYHSDDEAFLGENPSIASLSLGASRDFYFRRKAPAGVEVPKSSNLAGTKGSGPAATRPTEKFLLSEGDLLLMRGKTQADYEHAIPKRANSEGRINITFRTVLNAKGTENFQRYNRGNGSTFRFRNGKMVAGGGGI